MITSVSVFSRASCIFENARHASLTLHKIEFGPAARLAQASSRLFQMLDRMDPIQSEVLRRLWVLRSTVLFTLLPFDSPALKLLVQLNELEQLSDCLPDTKELINILKECVTEAHSLVRNPKRELVISMLSSGMNERDATVGILTALAAGEVPGWPRDEIYLLSELGPDVLTIRSRRDLRSNLYPKVILPCACGNVPETLLSDLVFGCVSSRIDVLLYSNEQFRAPTRPMLPSDRIFEGRLQSSEIEREIVEVQSDAAFSAIDAWVNEAFWQGIHGSSRSGGHGLSAARYMLFFDGTGVFLPENGRVVTLPKYGRLMDERDLCMVRVDELAEDDAVVLRSGKSGVLLDHASDRIIGQAGNEDLLEAATDWKNALDALLVTHSASDVARALTDRGVATSAATINRWVGPEVLGPGSHHAFKELVSLLASKGKIQKAGSDLSSYTDSRWDSLQALRTLHQKAGNLIRQDLFEALFRQFRSTGGIGAFSGRERISIDGDVDAELLVLRVASVDANTAYVPQARLGRIDDHKGSKWLG